MFLKLEMQVTDDAGNPIKSCNILKCHKQEGDRIQQGDPLFDIEVSEIIIPAHLGSVWSDVVFLHKRCFEICDLVAETPSRDTTARTPIEDRPFSFRKVSYKQVVALDSGI